MTIERYIRQMTFNQIRKEGQERLLASRVAIVGMGALGTVAANHLCRSGVGYLRLIDRDLVDLSNLQRQILYTEEDARLSLPKAIVAAEHLQLVNSEITIEPVVADLNASNAEALLKGVDLVLDGGDNYSVRLLINDVCSKYAIPWIYCGAVGSSGMTMNILPDEGPCFRCLVPKIPPAGSVQTCSTVGVLSMLTGFLASAQALEAIKILTGSKDIRKTLMAVDMWDWQVDFIPVEKKPDCPACSQHHYEYLEQKVGNESVTSLCGQNAIQVLPIQPGTIDFAAMAKRLEQVGTVSFNSYMLRFSDGRVEINFFKDGRAIIKNAKNEGQAKSIYAEYIG
jgi:adenylyltransferase/sulfurtransferase